MKEQTIQDIAMQKILTLSEQDAVKVLIFMAGLDAGSKLPSAENTARKSKGDRKF